MSINVEAWKTLISVGQTTTPLSAVANNGDVESVENALEAGMAKAGVPDRLIAASELADAAVFCGTVPARVEGVLKKWVSLHSADDAAHALISLTSRTTQRSKACEVLIRAGADPYREVHTTTAKQKTNISAVENALTYTGIEALENLAGLLGSAPITDVSQLPRLLSYTNTTLHFPQACNALERAIAGHNMHAAAWIVGRIDRDSPARELLFALGDIALQLLNMDQAGRVLSQTMSSSNTGLANAYRYILGGAAFRSPDLLEKVCSREITANHGQPFLSSSVVTRNSGMTSDHFHACLGMFIDNGCLKIDAADHNGHTMLMNAAINDSHDVVDLLLQRGASVTPTAIVEGRKTPVDALYYARKVKNPEMINKILAATARQAIARTIDTARHSQSNAIARAAP